MCVMMRTLRQKMTTLSKCWCFIFSSCRISV